MLAVTSAGFVALLAFRPLRPHQRPFGAVAWGVHLAGFGRLVHVSRPEDIREVFRGDPAVLHAGEGNILLATLVGQTSVLVLDDEPHARQRRVLMPPLKGERMRTFFDAMRREALATAEARLEALRRRSHRLQKISRSRSERAASVVCRSCPN